MHIHVCISIHIYIYTRIYVYMYRTVLMGMEVHMNRSIPIHLCMCKYVYIYVYTYIFVCIDVYIKYVLYMWYIPCQMCMDRMKAESSSGSTPRECLCGKQGCRCQSHRKMPCWVKNVGRAWSTEGSCTSLPFPGRWRGKTFCAVLNITLCVLPPGGPVWALGPGADSHWLEGPGMSLKSGLSWTVWSSVNVCTLLGLHLSQCGIFHLWIKLLFRYCALRQMANLPRGTVPLHMGYTFMYILSCVMSNVITFYIQEHSDISLYILLSSYCTLGPLSRLCKWHFCRLKLMSCSFKRISSSADCIFSLKMFTRFLFLPHSHFCFAKQFLQERKTGSHFPRGCWVTHHIENHC